MKIRLLHAWKVWSVGHIIPEMAPNVARELIRKGIGEEVVEKVAVVPQADRAMRASQMTLKSSKR